MQFDINPEKEIHSLSVLHKKAGTFLNRLGRNIGTKIAISKGRRMPGAASPRPLIKSGGKEVPTMENTLTSKQLLAKLQAEHYAGAMQAK